MRNYITRTGKPVEGGIEHPNTHDQDKSNTHGNINFIQYGYQVDGINLAIIEYDENTVTQQNLIEYGQIEPSFNLTIITEEDANIFLSKLGDVSVKGFIFTDNRPIDLI